MQELHFFLKLTCSGQQQLPQTQKHPVLVLACLTDCAGAQPQELGH